MSDEPPDERGADPAGDDDPARDPADRPTATMPGAGERSGSAETRARLGAASLFGRYRLLSRIGTGGFGEVWEAEESDTGRRVAVKFRSHARAGEGAIRERFAREATLAAALNDPRCVYVFGGSRRRRASQDAGDGCGENGRTG